MPIFNICDVCCFLYEIFATAFKRFVRPLQKCQMVGGPSALSACEHFRLLRERTVLCVIRRKKVRENLQNREAVRLRVEAAVPFVLDQSQFSKADQLSLKRLHG